MPLTADYQGIQDRQNVLQALRANGRSPLEPRCRRLIHRSVGALERIGALPRLEITE